MKKYFLLIMCMLLTIEALAQFSGSGTGTQSDPYRIYNPDQLNQIRNFQGKSDVYFSLEADIDLKEWIEENNPTQGWMPIGSSSSPFIGIFEGNGHTLSNLYINRSDMNNVGFFGYCSAKVSNVIFSNAQGLGKDCTGILCGDSNGGTYSNIKVITSMVTGNQYVGGICGRASESGNLTNCCVNKSKINGKGYVGGLVGEAGSIYNSFVIADINEDTNCRKSDYVGGICGYSTSSSENCHFYGTIYGRNYVGGIFGRNNNNYIRKLKRSSANANIFGIGDNIGGISGYVGYDIEDVYFTGSVYGNNYVGGIGGNGSSYRAIRRAVSHARVILGNSYVGGVAGDKTTVENSISANEEISGHDNIYRVVPSSSDRNNLGWVKTKMFEDGQQITVEDGSQHGNSIGLSALKLKATYQGLGWDFTDTWAIQDTECFPYFKVQIAPPYFTQDIVAGTTTLTGKCIEDGIVNITIGKKEYTTVSSGYEWSVDVDMLATGDEIEIRTTATDKLPSYTVYATVKPSGSGTEADPYQVFSAEDMQMMKMNASDHYKLMNDIDLTGWIEKNNPTEGWNAVGNSSAVLMASFDGNCHTISGLWANTTSDYAGLFARSNGSAIKNLTVKIAEGKQLKGGNYVGAIAAYNSGNIENCKVIGDVTATGNAGGVSGYNSGVISECSYNGNVKGTGTGCVGGLVGENAGSIVKSCTFNGSVSSTGAAAKAGGLCGKSSGSIENCYSFVPVTASATDTEVSAAGLVGHNEGSVAKCYASGNVESGYKGSGVVGYNYGSNATISNCIGLNKNVSAKNSAFRVVGGFANGAASPGTDNKAIKSMVLSVNGVPMKIYDDPLNGYAIEDALSRNASTYSGMGWDMSSTWSINENNGHPYLENVSEPDIVQTYTLMYILDGEEYATETHEEGETITPLENPTKDGYAFSGWSEIPSVMPASDVTVTGTFVRKETSEASTDISQMTDVLYSAEMKAKSGKQIVLPIYMKNSEAVTLFQTNVYLPQGFTFAKKANGKYAVSLMKDRLTDEDDNHVISSNVQPDGSLLILCSSQDNYTFDGNDGLVATVTIDVADDVAEGPYLIKLNNQKMVRPDNTGSNVAEYQVVLTVKNYTLGDVNDDGDIDGYDLVGISNLILGTNTDGLIRDAADVNSDGDVDGYDYVMEVNTILGTNASAAKGKNPTLTENALSALTIPTMNVAAGEQTQLAVGMECNGDVFTLVQTDIEFPEGVEPMLRNGRVVAKLAGECLGGADDHSISCVKQGSGKYRILIASQDNTGFTGKDGQLFTVGIETSKDMLPGMYDITLSNTKLVRANSTGVNPSDVTAMMVCNGTTGINGVEGDNADEQMYNLKGQRVSKHAQRGVYISNGKKNVKL